MRSDKAIDAKELKFKQTLSRSAMLRRNGAFLPEASFKTRLAYFNHPSNGVLRAKVPKAPNPMANMNPMAMMDMMKGNITFIVPNMAMMAIINQFFQGYVLVPPQRFSSEFENPGDPAPSSDVVPTPSSS